MLFCLPSSCVLCVPCCQCFWIVNSVLSFLFSITFDTIAYAICNTSVECFLLSNNRSTGNTGHTRHRTKASKTTTKTIQNHDDMSSIDPTTNRGEHRCSQFLSLIRHAPFYLYSHAMLDTPMHKQTQITSIRREPSNKQLKVKTNLTSFSCGNRTGHNSELRQICQTYCN